MRWMLLPLMMMMLLLLLVRSWDEHVVAWPTRGSRYPPGWRGCEGTPWMTVEHLAEKARTQRQGLRWRRTAARLVGHVQQADAPTREESEDDGCQVLLTDGDDADAALVVPGKEADFACDKRNSVLCRFAAIH